MIEILTRKGNQIVYEATVEDPEVLAKPWVMTPKILTLSKLPDAEPLPKRGNCEVYETKGVTFQIHH